MKYWTVPPEWTGERCFILAGGPSLKGFNAWSLRGRGRVLAINMSFRLAPWADCLYFCDRRWWDLNGREVQERFTGRHLVTMDNDIPDVRALRNTGPRGLETDPSGLRTGSNSGYQAINLAYHFGARSIVLLGYDMHVDGQGTHWHAPYPWENPEVFAGALRTSMLPKFDSLVEPLRQAGVEVLNATLGSALQCWPKVTLRDLKC